MPRLTASTLRALTYVLVALSVALIVAGFAILFTGDGSDARGIASVVVAGVGGFLGPIAMIPATLAAERS